METFFDNIKILIQTFKLRDFFDILIVTFLVYQVIKLIRESRAGQLVKGILMFLVARFLAYLLDFRMLKVLLDSVFTYGIIALIIVFQPELRRILEQMGRSKIGNYWTFGSVLSSDDEKIKMRQIQNVIKAVILSVSEFKAKKTGALIVFERHTRLGEIIDTGTLIKGKATNALISSVFFDKAPLHDGALIIKNGLVYAGGCILPLTKNENLSPTLGTRHRAALGMSENSDAVTLVVSEETGDISVALSGKIKKYAQIDVLKRDLENLLA